MKSFQETLHQKQNLRKQSKKMKTFKMNNSKRHNKQVYKALRNKRKHQCQRKHK